MNYMTHILRQVDEIKDTIHGSKHTDIPQIAQRMSTSVKIASLESAIDTKLEAMNIKIEEYKKEVTFLLFVIGKMQLCHHCFYLSMCTGER